MQEAVRRPRTRASPNSEIQESVSECSESEDESVSFNVPRGTLDFETQIIAGLVRESEADYS